MIETISYMAGIFDGEGCVALHEKKTKKGLKYYRPKVTVTNTDPRLIKFCLETFGGSYSTYRPKNKKVEYLDPQRNSSSDSLPNYYWRLSLHKEGASKHTSRIT